MSIRNVPGALPLFGLDAPGSSVVVPTVGTPVVEQEEVARADVDPRIVQQNRTRFSSNTAQQAQRIQAGLEPASTSQVEQMLRGFGVEDQMGLSEASSQLSEAEALDMLRALGLDVGDSLSDPRTQGALRDLKRSMGYIPTEQTDLNYLIALLLALARQRRDEASGGYAPSTGGGGVAPSGGGDVAPSGGGGSDGGVAPSGGGDSGGGTGGTGGGTGVTPAAGSGAVTQTGSGKPGESMNAPVIDQHRMNSENAGGYCGVATVMSTVAAKTGKLPADPNNAGSLGDFASQMYTPGAGSSGEAMAGVLRNHGMSAQFNTAGSLKDVNQTLKSGQAVPVGVTHLRGEVLQSVDSARYGKLDQGQSVDNQYGSSGHWIAVVGVEGSPDNPSAYIVNDSDTGTRIRMTPEQLAECAAGEGNMYVIHS